MELTGNKAFWTSVEPCLFACSMTNVCTLVQLQSNCWKKVQRLYFYVMIFRIRCFQKSSLDLCCVILFKSKEFENSFKKCHFLHLRVENWGFFELRRYCGKWVALCIHAYRYAHTTNTLNTSKVYLTRIVTIL